jgi:hypothetical protein
VGAAPQLPPPGGLKARPWSHFQFLRLVWYKATHRAAVAWRDQHGLPVAVPTPFDGKGTTAAAIAWREQHGHPAAMPTPFDHLQPHDLRTTAATLMRDAGFDREQAAARWGTRIRARC